MADLIFDRTEADVLERTPKGFLNYGDLNRIETWTETLCGLLTERGYYVACETKTNWLYSSVPFLSEMNRIRRNIVALQDCYFSIPEWKDFTYREKIDFTDVNAWEWDLQQINLHLESMAISLETFRQANSFFMEASGVLNG